MSFDVNIGSAKPVIKAAANTNNDGGSGGNLGYMMGGGGQKKKENQGSLFSSKPARFFAVKEMGQGSFDKTKTTDNIYYVFFIDESR